MTKEQFDSLYYGKIIHCDTEEKANDFLTLADSVGYRWFSGKSLIEGNEWEIFKKETCYEVTKYGFFFIDKKNFELDGYQIIEYEPQPKFKVGDTVRIKNTAFIDINGKVGIIVDVDASSMPYFVQFGHTAWTMWFYESQLEKFEEPKAK